MNVSNDNALLSTYAIAEQAIQRYANGLLSVPTLVALMQQELAREEAQRHEEMQPSAKLLKRIAQRVCSRTLWEAWQSTDERRRDSAFDNIRRYLKETLLRMAYAQRLQAQTDALEDVLNQTMEVLYVLATKKSGPNDPATFLKWTQTILVRQAHAFLKHSERDTAISLEQQMEHFAEQFVDIRNSDPLDVVLHSEMHAILVQALLSLRNPNYRWVLFATYILNLDDSTIATQLEVSVNDIHLWRYRALKALRKHPEIIKLFHSLLE
jgi:RNA polymerase sigma factor (sigma-70 family)